MNTKPTMMAAIIAMLAASCGTMEGWRSAGGGFASLNQNEGSLGPYFDKNGTIKVRSQTTTASGTTYATNGWRSISSEPEENTHFNAASMEANGVAVNTGAGDALIYLPAQPSSIPIPTIVGTTRLSDHYGNRAVGSVVYGKQNGRIYFRGYVYYWEGSSNRLVLSAPTSLDQMLGSKNDMGNPLDSKALLRPGADGKLEFVMERVGDYIAVPNPSATPIGVGSEMRFDTEKWVEFLGAKYRKGGFKVTPEGVQFDDATEKNDGGKVFKHQGSQWMPIETN